MIYEIPVHTEIFTGCNQNVKIFVSLKCISNLDKHFSANLVPYFPRAVMAHYPKCQTGKTVKMCFTSVYEIAILAMGYTKTNHIFASNLEL